VRGADQHLRGRLERPDERRAHAATTAAADSRCGPPAVSS
jgi:hypothetical protein